MTSLRCILKECKSRNIRSTAIFSTLAPRHIISKTSRSLNPNIRAIFLQYNTLQRNIQKIRQRANIPYPFSGSVSNLIILDEFKNTVRGQPCTVADILSESGELTTVLVSRINLNYFSQGNSIYFDATFKTVPQYFSQLFTIHATNFTTTVPCVYALMQRKTKEAYDIV
ncbi:hypothetical protein HZS_6858 [Henneguya salminicola]|nr:hypothetical protein HZS_6858 [Henneguya salminicola]